MDQLPPIDAPAYRLGARKALMFACAVPTIALFGAMFMQLKGLIDVTQFGLAERYLYIGGLSVFLVALVARLVMWRCPGCGSYLGREANPATCRKCGARFS